MLLPFALAIRTKPSAAAKLLLCRLRDRIGCNAYCWVGQRRLCDDCGFASRGVLTRATAELEGAGLLVVDRSDPELCGPRRERLNRYRLTPDGAALFSPPDPDDGGSGAPSGPEAEPSNRRESRPFASANGREVQPLNGSESVPFAGPTGANRYHNQTNQPDNYPPTPHSPPPLMRPAPRGEMLRDALNGNGHSSGGTSANGNGHGSAVATAGASTSAPSAADDVAVELAAFAFKGGERLLPATAKRLAAAYGPALLRYAMRKASAGRWGAGMFATALDDPASAAQLATEARAAAEQARRNVAHVAASTARKALERTHAAWLERCRAWLRGVCENLDAAELAAVCDAADPKKRLIDRAAPWLGPGPVLLPEVLRARGVVFAEPEPGAAATVAAGGELRTAI